MKGFFQPSQLISKPPASLVPKCGACGLFKTCHSPKMEPSGRGIKKILVVGEAPGATEDEEGLQFVGEAGETLDKYFRKCGIDMRKDCLITNALICRPPANKTPTDKQIDYCRPNLLKTMKQYDPNIIILLGGVATESFIGYYWKQHSGGIGRWAGFIIPSYHPNAWVCPTYHPSYLNRINNPVADLLFERHLRAALACKGKPWDTIPMAEVNRIYDDSEAAAAIRSFCKGRYAAFDYETNMLKADSEQARIVCASISDGKRTIAFPFDGKVIPAMSEFVISDCLKIAANLKFETRWSIAKLGISPRNWWHDTMLAAHWLDCRPDITGLKFQAYARLGVLSYDDHIRPFLRESEGNKVNRIKDIAMKDLLLYCGTDSLLEYRLAFKQREQLETSDDGSV